MDHERSTPPGRVVNAAAGSADQVLQVGHVAGDVHVHGDPAPSLPPPRQLPREVTHFTGRAAELSKLDALLGNAGSARSSTVVISAIAGAPGIGKTSLAVHWSHQVRERFPDGQLYVNLRGYDASPPLSADHVLDAFLRALGLPAGRIPQDTDAKASVYRSFLAERRMLVLLDNAATPDQIRPLLPNEPGCLVLVTSRSRLSGLVARDGAHRISLDLLAPDEASSLLRDIVGQDRTDREPKAVDELARRCAYLPLALRITAERLAARPRSTVAELVHELADERQRLDVLAAADDDECTAVRTVFSWSYHSLPRDTARMFRQLGLHPGPTISLDAATALTGSTTTVTRRLLDNLVAVHLLAETESRRYQFHDLLRDYAAEQALLDEPDAQCGLAVQRLFEWYLHTAHAALFAYYPLNPELPIDSPPATCRALEFTGLDHARRWLSTEYPNLVALIRRAPNLSQHTACWQLTIAIGTYMMQELPVADRIDVHRHGLAAAQHTGHQLGQAWAYLNLGSASRDAHHYDDAIEYGQRVLAISRSIDAKFMEGAALGNLARCFNDLRRYTKAAELGNQSLSIYRKIGNLRNVGLSLIQLGESEHGLGQLEQANAHIQQGLDIVTALKGTTLQALALRCQAKIFHAQGQRDLAIQSLNRAALLSKSVRDDRRYGDALNQLGELYNDIGEPDQSRNAWREAIAVLAYLDPPQADRIRIQLNSFENGNINDS
ncbi:ATP-binding protein [Actinokineospora iranica]|uniref:Predicted ATPase n=1 Tax=Actinokineospora iranica TaxID=1271860 RepID=A0A1G6WSQ8_9PSEU|nr:tetratricopeptide repeat protein [Actinokineospora iranica]SDD68844.1 Predicted ATPase [Actinokineospora iranica]